MNGRLHTAADPGYHSHPEVTSAVVVTTSTARPANAREGQLIYETDTDRLLVYDGTNWIQPSGPVRYLGTPNVIVGGSAPNPATSPVPFRMASGSDVQTYVTGGLTVTYPVAFSTGISTVILSEGDNNAVVPAVVSASGTLSTFKYKIFDMTGAEVGAGGLYRINWLAVGW